MKTLPSRGYIHAKLVEKKQKGKLEMPDMPDSLKEPKRFDIEVVAINESDSHDYKVGKKVFLKPEHRAVELGLEEGTILVISTGDIFTYEA
jgi:hypothetical protein